MKNLKEINNSREFYDDRYLKGYMEEWPTDKKKKIYEIIKKLSLPEKGEALDFGCGNGIFTIILKECLPNWTVYGCDLSSVAIRNAQNKIKNCTFFINGDPSQKDKKFDLIFSHHVLEHVFDIEEISKQITNLSKEKSYMLHILPCGNPNSFEWKICNLRENGIEKDKENRFFYEDPGHVRRMTTKSCAEVFNKFGFILSQGYYTNQYHGAINWITRVNPLIMISMFNPLKGKDLLSKIKLLFFLIKNSFISCLRMPYIIYKKFDKKIIKVIFFIPAIFSKYVDNYMINKSDREWSKLRERENGSEMFLFFKKN
jgi:ubiquinone/menaquinone biosynthesis C-methylase UbiE